MSRKKILACIIVLLACARVHGQIPATTLLPNQDPPSVSWKEIETAHFRIIFPAEAEADARRVADTMEHLWGRIHHTLPAADRKTPIILRTNYSESNGFAALAPRRSEWYNTPPQNSFAGVVDWYDALGLHEYRHMVQFDSLDTGMNRVVRYLTGQEGYMGIIVYSTPIWFFEGDSVLTETLLSRGGRGRTPSFDVELRALLLNGRRYGYYKAMLGSRKHYDPLVSPYLLGYFMNAHIRKKYGADALVKANRATSHFPILPYRHTNCVDTVTGKYSADIYEDVMDELTALWKAQQEGLRITPVRTVAQGRKKDWTRHLSPRYLGGGRMAWIRYSMYDMSRIEIVDGKTGSVLDEVDAMPMGMHLGAAADRVVWAQEVPDPRWGMKSFSDIYMYDAASGRSGRLTRGQRFHAPALSPDGKRIVAVEFDRTNRCSLVMLDSSTGVLLSRIQLPDNGFIQTPSWSTDGSTVVFCLLGREGKGVYMYRPATGETSMVMARGYENITDPVSDGRYVYYSSEYSGIDGLYALDTTTGKRFRIASRPFGAYSPSLSPDGRQMIFSDVDGTGYTVASIDLDPAAWEPLESVDVRKVNYFEPVAPQETGYALENIPTLDHRVKDYGGIDSIFSIHSWYPAVSPLSRDISIAVKSTNLLGTVGARVGYVYNWNENGHAGLATVSYAGLYPIFDVNGVIGTRGSTYNYTDPATGKKSVKFYSWMEKSGGVGVRLPLNFSRGLTDTRLTLGIRGDVVQITDQTVDFNFENNNGLFTPVTYYMSFSRLTSWQNDINPRWGQTLDLSFAHTPFKTDYHGKLFSAVVVLFFPGIFRANSLFFEGGFEYQEGDEYHFSSMMLFPRGYPYTYNDVFTKGSVNYTFPILHPDLNIYLCYIKRIYVNLFHDMGVALHGGGADYYRSAGTELLFEVNPIALPLPLHIGARWSYLFDRSMADGKRNDYSLVVRLGYIGY